MTFSPSSDDEAAQAIARLADGTPDARERAYAGPPVPPHLLDAVDEHGAARRRSRVHPGGRGGGGGHGGWLTGWRAAAALGAALAVALVIVLASGGLSSGSTPSITAAAKLAYMPATQPAPAVRDADYLDASYGGVTFPNYARLHAVATGKLTDTIGGRPAVTVFYRLRDGARLSYTVFSGPPVPLPKAARPVLYGGDVQAVPLEGYRTADGLSVVTLVRYGRTCVLAARTAQDVVLGLAAEPVAAAGA
jgi:hypothetical protein